MHEMMSKGSKDALTFLIVTHFTHVKRVKSGVCGYVHNRDVNSYRLPYSVLGFKCH